MESMKEKASNVAASARAGMEKTKATLEEKAEKMKAGDPITREKASEKKEARINEAEMEKREAREHNAAVREAAKAGAEHTAGYTAKGITGGGHTESVVGSATYSTTGQTGHPTGGHQMSALPGHGTGQPAGSRAVEGAAAAHPASARQTTRGGYTG